MASREELGEFVQRMDEIMDEIKKLIIDILNDRGGLDKLTAALEKWKGIRQEINNKNVGILIAPDRWRVVSFNLRGDQKTDLGQKNLLAENVAGPPITDEDFLKNLGMKS